MTLNYIYMKLHNIYRTIGLMKPSYQMLTNNYDKYNYYSII